MARIGNMSPAEFCLGETTNTKSYYREHKKKNKNFFSEVLNSFFYKVSGAYSTTAFMDVLDIASKNKEDWEYFIKYLDSLPDECTTYNVYEQRIRFLNDYSKDFYYNDLPKIDKSILFKVIPHMTFDSEGFIKKTYSFNMCIRNTLNSAAIGMLINNNHYSTAIDINDIIAKNHFVINDYTIAKTHCIKMLEMMNEKSYDIIFRCNGEDFYSDMKTHMMMKLRKAHPDYFFKSALYEFKRNFKANMNNMYGGLFDKVIDRGVLTPDMIFKENFDDAVDLVTAYMMLND